jgi:hypothetical protein
MFGGSKTKGNPLRQQIRFSAGLNGYITPFSASVRIHTASVRTIEAGRQGTVQCPYIPDASAWDEWVPISYEWDMHTTAYSTAYYGT